MEFVRQRLAASLGMDPAQLQLDYFEPVDWPDACLGATGPGEMCAQIITPGYRGLFIAPAGRYEFHSDQSGAAVRFIPGAAVSARQALATQLGLPEEQVILVSYEQVEWSNGCLDLEQPGETCTQAFVPGYLVRLQAGDRYYNTTPT